MSDFDQTSSGPIELSTAILLIAPYEVQHLVIPITRHYSPHVAIQIPAHFTVLVPFVPYHRLDAACETVREICAAIEPFDVTIDGYDRFPLTTFIKPVNPEPIQALFRKIYAAFPECPPYRGRFGNDLHPHMTVAQFSTEAEQQTAKMPEFAPITFRAERVHVLYGSETLQLPWITHSVLHFNRSTD